MRYVSSMTLNQGARKVRKNVFVFQMLITLGFLPDKVGSWCLGGEQTTRGQTVLR